MQMTFSKAYQITSNEHVESIFELIEDAARLHEFSLAISDPISFNAPFCGDEYFTQNIKLLSVGANRTNADFEECVLEIERIVQRELSEGFVDSPCSS